MMELKRQQPVVGITWSPYLKNYLSESRCSVDFIEISYEQIRQGTDYTDLTAPTILHCASLSLAGYIKPATSLVHEVREIVEKVKSPWVGEHLAYISAESLERPGEIINAGFTFSPRLSKESLSHIKGNWKRLQNEFSVPLIIENPPQYFSIPGSTMTMAEFMSELCHEYEIGILLDLSHLYLSSINLGLDPYSEVQKLPWKLITEVHISGSRFRNDVLWDDHGQAADETVWKMLEFVLTNCNPKAITLEYNWLTHYAVEFFPDQISRIRTLFNKYEVSYAD